MSMGKKHLSNNSLSYRSTGDEENGENNNCKNSLFFGLFDDFESTRLRSGSMKRQYSDMGDLYHRVYEEHEDGDDDEGLRMDMRVLMVLEYMRELYVGQLQLLKTMFPGGAKDEFLGFFNKIGDAMSQFKQDSSPPAKSMTMQRSLSAGSPRVTLRGVITLGPSDLRDERFKIRTVDAGEGNDRFKITTVDAGERNDRFKITTVDAEERNDRFKITTVRAGDVPVGGAGGVAGGGQGGSAAGQGQTTN